MQSNLFLKEMLLYLDELLESCETLFWDKSTVLFFSHEWMKHNLKKKEIAQAHHLISVTPSGQEVKQ